MSISLSTLLLAIFLILLGLNYFGIAAIGSTILGLLALITGILYLIEAIHPVVIKRP